MLFHTGLSLVCQAATWVREHRRFGLRILASSGGSMMSRALDGAVLAIVDATEHPGQAMATLEAALERVSPERVAVYTERAHDGLELFVRARGVSLLLGPMEPDQWDAMLQPRTGIAVRLPPGKS